jgi:hypothetical protein
MCPVTARDRERRREPCRDGGGRRCRDHGDRRGAAGVAAADPAIPLIILAALVLDGVDNSLLAHFSSIDLGPGGPYQSFDKALDIYYLAIAYLAAMRN